MGYIRGLQGITDKSKTGNKRGEKCPFYAVGFGSAASLPFSLSTMG